MASSTKTLNWPRVLRAKLPREVFEPARSRLLWLPVHWTLIALEIFAVREVQTWPLRLGLSLLLGFSFAGLAFVAHEALHGALSSNRAVKEWVGGLGFLPFCLSPRLWMAWHNRVHHSNTNKAGVDPDCLATLDEFHTHRSVRVSTFLQTKSLGLLTLLLGFTMQSATVLVRAKQLGYLSARHYRRALLETAFAILFWLAIAVWVGPGLFVWVYAIPLLVGNAIVMAHIITNHGQMPLDEGEGPLATSLSVTVPRWFSFYTLDFGYHVEHHLMPTVSHRHGPKIRALLLEMAPEEYHSMPLLKALGHHFKNLRVYADAHTLLDPETGRSALTLGSPETPKPPPAPKATAPEPNRTPSQSRAPSRPISVRPSPAH